MSELTEKSESFYNQMVDYKLKINHLAHNSDEFMLMKTEELINKIIVDQIVSRMKANNFDMKIWMNTTVKDVRVEGDYIKAVIHNEYWSDSGFDVAIARERGTKDHWIRPKLKLVLSWIHNGKRLFSKGHIVSGIKSLYIIRNTISANQPLVQDILHKEFDKWQESIMGS